MKKILIMLLLFIPFVYGMNTTDNYELMKVDYCYDNITIIDYNYTGHHNYNFLNFTPKRDEWIFKCDNLPIYIIINSSANKSQDYNFGIKYNIGPIIKTNTSANEAPTKQDIENDNNERYFSFEGLTVTVEQKVNEFKMPEFTPETLDTLLKIGLGLIIFIIIAGFALYKIYNKENYETENDETDDDFFRKNI